MALGRRDGSVGVPLAHRGLRRRDRRVGALGPRLLPLLLRAEADDPLRERLAEAEVGLRVLVEQLDRLGVDEAFRFLVGARMRSSLCPSTCTRAAPQKRSFGKHRGLR